MERELREDVATEPSLFSVHQLHPRAALAIAQQATWKWLRTHVAGFGSLVRDHDTNWVILGAHVHYLRPFGGHDADAFEARVAGVRLRRNATILEVPVALSAASRPFVRTRVLYRTMALGGDATLSSATPGAIGGELFARFRADECDPAPLPRTVPAMIETIEREGRLLAHVESPFVTHRHLCELADQWCYVELPVLVSVARETMIRTRGRETTLLRQGLSRPLRAFDAEFRRPFLLFDSGRIATEAYVHADAMVFVHRLLGRPASGEIHALAVEAF